MGAAVAQPRCLLPVLYPRGIPTGDFREAFSAILGAEAPNLSPGVISRLTGEWQQEHDRWQRRDLSARRYVYIWADGVYLQARMEPQAECMLVILGATPEGKKELVGFQVGVRESAQSWRELLVDIKARGLAVPPEVAVGDGAMGFWKALDEVFPGTRHQRCWVHKIANVLNKFPKSMQPTVKADLREIWQPEIDEEQVKELHAKIGELAVANSFLERKLKPWGGSEARHDRAGPPGSVH
jgi:transposase-like protein